MLFYIGELLLYLRDIKEIKMMNPYHVEFKHNPTLRQARVLSERLPNSLLYRQHVLLTHNAKMSKPTVVVDKIQKRRSKNADRMPPNYLESHIHDRRHRAMY